MTVVGFLYNICYFFCQHLFCIFVIVDVYVFSSLVIIVISTSSANEIDGTSVPGFTEATQKICEFTIKCVDVSCYVLLLQI